MKLDFNLNNVVFIILITILSIWGGRQLIEKKALKKEIEYTTEELQNYRIYLTKAEKKIVDSVNYYQEEISYLLKQHRMYKKQIESHKAIIIDSIYKLSIEESKLFVDSVYSKKEGDTIPITETQLKDIHVTTLKLKECELFSDFQKDVIDQLDTAYNNCYKSVDILQENLNECSEINNENTKKIKSLKNKVWCNRIVSVLVTGLAVLLAL